MSSVEKIRSKQRTRKLFQRVIRKTLQRPEKLTVSEWAEKYRILGETSNFKGKWMNEITPYLKAIMDTFNDPYIQEINFVKPTQVGGTEAMLNMIGWIIMDDPAPTMLVYPDDEMAKEISSDRLRPSLTKTPEIKEKFYEKRSKELDLRFQGMNIHLHGARTPGKLAMTSIKYLFIDEIDKIGGASQKEASPYSLAKERTRTFSYSKKIYTCSTPTIKTNYVWNIHEDADEQYEYFVPCPHCNTEITLKFKQIRYPEDGENIDRAKEAIYVCQECGCEINDKEKIAMVRKGEWRCVSKKGLGKAKKVSFWMNALYSRFLTWEEIALEFLDSYKDPERLQNFVNSWLAEPWEDKTIRTDESTVHERETEIPKYIVPEWAKMLTAGVDVQKGSVYWTIRAWGDHMTSQNIAHSQEKGLDDIADIMNYEYRKESGESLFVQLCLIDSGYDTDNVYEFCLDNSEWAMPAKGSSNPMATHYRISTVNKPGSRASGTQLVVVDGGKYKDAIASRMRKENGEGSWMVYKDCDEDYALQVTAEHKIATGKGKNRIFRWEPKKTHADNHYLDTEVYSFAAADICGVRMLHLQEEEEIEQEPENEEEWISNNEDWIGGS